jgi:FAD/FMN-containing dehydrogenase
MPLQPPAPDRGLFRDLAALAGSVAVPGDPAYQDLVAPWNSAVPSRPIAAVEVADAGEVARVVRYAAAHGIRVAVQCTGHGAADVLDEAILVVTRRLDELTVHAEERWVRVGAGVTWQPVLDALAPFGLAALAGSSPGVGVVGYTTGGGFGPLARTHGAAAHRVRAFDVVTGDGQIRRATAEEHPDLFWALRGGKGALGIVTALEMDALPIPDLYAGALYADGAHAPDLVEAWVRWSETLPAEATTSLALLRLPLAPGVPEPLAGRFTIAIRFAWTGDPTVGAAVLAPMRQLVPLLLDGVGMMPYAALGRIHSDPVDPFPAHESAGLLATFPRAAIRRLLDMAGPDAHCPQMVVELRQLGGAIRPLHGLGAGAFSGTDARFSLFTAGVAVAPAGDDVRASAVAIHRTLGDWLTGMALPNFAAGSGAARFRRIFGAATLERLRSVAAKYDPTETLLAGNGLGG